MTQEEKDLLLRDLCGRLSYGVKCAIHNDTNIHRLSGVIYDNHYKELYFKELDWKEYDGFEDIKYCKPYLFPLSSMTEEQKREYDSIIYYNIELHCERYYNVIDTDSFEELQEFYHKYHFDYRGLIPMGLANDATNLNIY